MSWLFETDSVFFKEKKEYFCKFSKFIKNPAFKILIFLNNFVSV